MRYITDTTEFQIEVPTIVTLGKFDGRHRGHQKLLRTMEELKAELGYATAVFTFLSAPSGVVSGQSQTVITTNLERRVNMERMGIDYLIESPFTEEIRHMRPEAFVKEILIGSMNAKVIVVGPDCRFGYEGEGNASLLKKLAQEWGYRLCVIEKEQDEERDISSTYIREELEKGNMEKANLLLGEPYSICGEVVHGDHIGGRILGFPTANLTPSPMKHLPRNGVYASRVWVDGSYYRGVTNIGRKPTVPGDYPIGVETHILDLDQDIYGSFIEVQLLVFERPERKFNSMKELKKQIGLDKDFVTDYFKDHPEITLGRIG